MHIPSSVEASPDFHSGYEIYRLPDEQCRACTVFHEPGPLRECVVPNFPVIRPITPTMSQAERDCMEARLTARNAFMDYIGPVLHGGAWDGHPMASHCTVMDEQLTMEPLL